MFFYSDYFIIPLSPDLFSIKGTENLGSKLVLWQKEWTQCNEAWKYDELPTPNGKPKFIGYVIQQHNLRSIKEGMTKGWKIFGERLEKSIQNNIVELLRKQNQLVEREDENYLLGKIPNLHKTCLEIRFFALIRPDRFLKPVRSRVFEFISGQVYSLIPYSLEAKKPVFDCTLSVRASIN